MQDDAGQPPDLREPRPPEPHDPGRPAIRGRDLLVVVAITVVLLLLVRLGLIARPQTVGGQIALLGLQSAIPLAVIDLVIVRGRGVPWSVIGLRAAPGGWYLRAVWLTLLVLPLVMLVNAFAQLLLVEGPARNPQIDVLAPIAGSWHGVAGLLLMAGIVAPIMEEVVFRGLFYGWLRAHLGVAAGTALSAFGFALAHGIPLLLPALFVQGVILAMVYERSGSLWPPIIIHGGFNAIMVMLLHAALAAGISPP